MCCDSSVVLCTKMKRHHLSYIAAALTITSLGHTPVWANDAASLRPDSGKLLATGGVGTVEGAGGGGITPWALISGYGSRDSYGANITTSYLGTQDFQLDTIGVAVGIMDRVELSLAKQNFEATKGPLHGLRIEQNILGVKVKLLGDAVYDQDSWMPQIAVGAEHKQNTGLSGLINGPVTTLGAKDTHGTDYYVAATKLFLAQSILADITLRDTKANQMGLLGFGGDRNNSSKVVVEGSLAYQFDRSWVAGVEYRGKPHNLSADNETTYYDVFVAWFPTKHISVTLAYVALGSIAAAETKNNNNQTGAYVSVQAGF